MADFTNREYCLEVSGPYACFTRPEFKVERVSYDVITPSAVQGIFEAIFWKPAIRWLPTKVEVLPYSLNGATDLGQWPRWMGVRRNEVGKTAGRDAQPIYVETARQQKSGMVLRDVRYRIHAELEFIPISSRKPEHRPEGSAPDENPGKYNAMFERRARKGQTFNQPYLGCREFACDSVRLVEDIESECPPLRLDRDLGFMLYGVDFGSLESDGVATPMFFRGELRGGVMRIPHPDDPEVLR